MGFDLVDHSIIAHTDSIVWLVCMELLGTGWKGIFHQAINVAPQALLNSSIQGRKIALSVRGKPNGVGHERGALKPKIFLDLLPGDQAAGPFHNVSSLFQIPPVL
jgi:hypothetical protein